MVDTKFSIIIKLVNGETMTFTGPDAGSFDFMQQGVLCIVGTIKKEVDQMGTMPPRKIHYRYTRNWIPFAQIKSVEVITNKELTDPEEIKKYQEFMKHGLDIMVTPISKRVPPTEEQVLKEIEKEKSEKPKTP